MCSFILKGQQIYDLELQINLTRKGVGGEPRANYNEPNYEFDALRIYDPQNIKPQIFYFVQFTYGWINP